MGQEIADCSENSDASISESVRVLRTIAFFEPRVVVVISDLRYGWELSE